MSFNLEKSTLWSTVLNVADRSRTRITGLSGSNDIIISFFTILNGMVNEAMQRTTTEATSKENDYSKQRVNEMDQWWCRKILINKLSYDGLPIPKFRAFLS